MRFRYLFFAITLILFLSAESSNPVVTPPAVAAPELVQRERRPEPPPPAPRGRTPAELPPVVEPEKPNVTVNYFPNIPESETLRLTIGSTTQWNSAITQIRQQTQYKAFILTLDSSVQLSGTYQHTPTFRQGVSVAINGIGQIAQSSFPYGGSLLVISNSTLIIDGDINLRGLHNNRSPLIHLIMNSTFELRNGELRGHTGGGHGNDGAVAIYRQSNFIMSGGTINGFREIVNGIVYISSGSFTMSGGTITDNTSRRGGAVSLHNGGIFTMTGGTITGNSAFAYAGTDGFGGGVYMEGGKFTMTGGTITGNTAKYGGGVYVKLAFGELNISGGTINGNTASEGEKAGPMVFFEHRVNDANRIRGVYYRSVPINPSDRLEIESSANPRGLPTISGQTLSGWTRQ